MGWKSGGGAINYPLAAAECDRVTKYSDPYNENVNVPNWQNLAPQHPILVIINGTIILLATFLRHALMAILDQLKEEKSYVRSGRICSAW